MKDKKTPSYDEAKNIFISAKDSFVQLGLMYGQLVADMLENQDEEPPPTFEPIAMSMQYAATRMYEAWAEIEDQMAEQAAEDDDVTFH